MVPLRGHTIHLHRVYTLHVPSFQGHLCLKKPGTIFYVIMLLAGSWDLSVTIQLRMAGLVTPLIGTLNGRIGVAAGVSGAITSAVGSH